LQICIASCQVFGAHFWLNVACNFREALLEGDEMTNCFVLDLFRKMAQFCLLISVGLLLTMFSSAYGYGYGGGWVNAHATFYGGSDASGTMGM